MADVEVQMYTTTEKKVRKVKKTSTTKRRESSDQGVSEVTITEVDKENTLAINDAEGYVPLGEDGNAATPPGPEGGPWTAP